MKKDPNEQLAFNFTHDDVCCVATSDRAGPSLKLVHSKSSIQNHGQLSEAEEREIILSRVVSYAKSLAW